MSRPMLSSAARRLMRPRSTISTISPSAVNFAASFCDTACLRPSLRPLAKVARGFSSQRITPRCSVLSNNSFRQRFPFSSSATRPSAKILQNLRIGEDGKELTIKISPRASERLREITDPTSSPSATKEANPYHHLRITVTSGGCHGFQYIMSLEPASKIDPEEDTVFEAEEQEGVPAGPGEAKVVMDEPSLDLLHGSTVDYTMELIGSQFKIVDNPRATSNCGCGTSFDVME